MDTGISEFVGGKTIQVVNYLQNGRDLVKDKGKRKWPGRSRPEVLVLWSLRGEVDLCSFFRERGENQKTQRGGERHAQTARYPLNQTYDELTTLPL